MKSKKLIKIVDICVISACLIACGVVACASILSSKKAYDEYYETAYEDNKKLLSTPVDIIATLKEGVTYYNNGLASPVAEDFNVSIKFQEYGSTDKFYTQQLDYSVDKYSISYDKNKFFYQGGDITFKYKKLEKAIYFTLTDLEVVSIRVKEMPYVTKYLTGTVFDSAGIVVEGVYNDGSVKELDTKDITFSTEPLTAETTKVEMTYYSNSGAIKGYVPVTVTNNLVDGKLLGILVREKAYCDANKPLSNVSVNVVGKYESGNYKLISPSEYTILNKDTLALFGTKVNLEIEYKADTSLKCSCPVYVRNVIQGEDTTIVGGNVVNETEYLQNNDGTFTSTGHTTAVAGNFSGSVRNGTQAYLEFTFNSTSETAASIDFRCSNSYLVQEGNSYIMKPLQLNLIADLIKIDEVGNQTLIPISDDVIIKGTHPNDSYAVLYNIYNEYTIGNVLLNKGENTIRLSFKNSSLNTCWSESPSTLNVDYIAFYAQGEETDVPSDIVSIAYGENAYIDYYSTIESFNPQMTYKDSHDVTHDLNPALVKFECLSGEKVFTKGPVTIKGTYIFNSAITVTGDINLRNEVLKFEAEDMEKHGSSALISKTGTEYIDTVATGNQVGVVSGFDNSTTYAGEGQTYLTFNIAVDSACERDIVIRCSNANISTDLGTDGNSLFVGYEYNLKSVLNLYVNGAQNKDFGGLVPEISYTANKGALWWSFFVIRCGKISLKQGNNIIKIEGNASGLKNEIYGQVAAPMIDYVILA